MAFLLAMNGDDVVADAVSVQIVMGRRIDSDFIFGIVLGIYRSIFFIIFYFIVKQLYNIIFSLSAIYVIQ